MTDTKYIDYESCEKIAGKRVIDKFHKEMAKSVKAPLGEHELIPVLDNLKGQFNLPRIVRTANLFACREVFVVGTEFFSPFLLDDMGYDIYALHPPSYGGQSLYDCNYGEKTAFIVGNEFSGLSFDPSNHECVRPVHIPQYGIVESLNVSVAMSIALSEWVRQHKYNTI
jgi:tRNA G18 (ribose-2'-O)-methylase SpoU